MDFNAGEVLDALESEVELKRFELDVIPKRQQESALLICENLDRLLGGRLHNSAWATRCNPAGSSSRRMPEV